MQMLLYAAKTVVVAVVVVALLSRVCECRVTPVRLAVWSSMGETWSLEASRARFEATHPNTTVHVGVSNEPELEPYMGWLSAPLGWDVMPTSAQIEISDELPTYFRDVESVVVDSGLLDDLVPAARKKAFASDGSIRGVPLFSDVCACFYQIPIFAELGLEVPNTWSELLGLCPVLEAAGKSCFSTAITLIPPTVYFDYMAVRMFGAEFYSQFLVGNVSLTEDPRVQDVLDVVASLAPHFATTKEAPKWAISTSLPGGFDRLYDLGEFAAGDVGVMCEYSSVIALGTRYRLLNASEIGAFRFPDYDLPVRGGKPAAGTDAELGWITSLGIPSNAVFPDAAKQMLAHLADADEQARFFAVSPLFPLRKSLNASVTGHVRAKVYETLKAASSTAVRSFGLAGSVVVSRPWSNLANSMLVAPTMNASTSLAAEQVPTIDALRMSAVFGETAAPVFDPPSGQFGSEIEVRLSSGTPGALIFYTLDGSEPGLTSAVYSTPIPLTLDGSTPVRAVALAEGLALSSLARADYVIQLPTQSPSSSSGTSLGIILAIVLPALCVVGVFVAVLGYVVHRRKSVTYRLSSDSELVIPSEELVLSQAVGQGSFGTVYKAAWRGSLVAVKQMHDTTMGPSQLREFVSEATLLLNLRHRNVLIFMGVTLDPLSIVTEYMERGSLYQVLHNPDIVIDTSMVFKWAHAMASGLFFLEQTGIVHGDFKSLNVLFDASWTAKICDFGLSSVKTKDSAATTVGKGARGKAASSRNQVSPAGGSFDLEANVSMSASNVGTLFWAAPEVLTGEGAMSSESDAFALGVTLWEMATRADLYAGLNPIAVALEVSMGRRPDVTGIASHFSDLVYVMTALWRAAPGDRMSLEQAMTTLDSLYSNDTLVFPMMVGDPTGVVHATALTLSGYSERLSLSADKAQNEVCKLVEFVEAVGTMAQACSGVVVEQGLGRAVVVFHSSESLGSFAEMLLTSKWGARCAGTVAHGEIKCDKDAGGHPNLSGPVVDALVTIWARSLGSGRVVEAGPLVSLSEMTTTAAWEQPPGRPRSQTGVFAARDLAQALVESSKQLVMDATEDGEDSPVMIAMPDELCAEPLSSSSADNDERDTPTWLVSGAVIAKMVETSELWTLGSYAKVYDAVWSGQPVIVKVLLKQDHSVEQLATIALSAARSAQAARAAGARAIGPIGLCLDRPHVALVFPRLEHGSLLDVLGPHLIPSWAQTNGGSQGPMLRRRSVMLELSPSTGMRVMADVARALADMHVDGVGHGSLKPSNVLLSVASDGVSVGGVLSDAALDPIKTNQGTMTMVPSVAYLSPESLAGHDATPAGDVFVFGTLLYELTTKSRAFGGANAIEVGTKILAGARPTLDNNQALSPELASLINDCWTHDPANRPQAATLVERLDTLVGTLAAANG